MENVQKRAELIGVIVGKKGTNVAEGREEIGQ